MSSDLLQIQTTKMTYVIIIIICVCVLVYICISRERERERWGEAEERLIYMKQNRKNIKMN